MKDLLIIVVLYGFFELGCWLARRDIKREEK